MNEPRDDVRGASTEATAPKLAGHGEDRGGDNGDVDPRLRNTVFLSYSHADKDAEWFTDVVQYLKQLSIGCDVKYWDDTEIRPGERWQDAIEDALRRAKAAVFVVTPTFLESDFVTSEEVPKILERQEMEGLVVHALIGKPSQWEDHVLGDFLRSRQLSHDPKLTLEEMEGPVRRRKLNDLVALIRRDIGIYRQRNSGDRRSRAMVELEEQLGITIEKEVASGETSIIYLASDRSKRQQKIAVKAMVSRPISDTGQGELDREFGRCRDLRSPVFVRVFDLQFHRGYCVTTADWVPGHRMSRLLAVSHRSEEARRLWQEKTTAILSALASAMAEAHDKGLRYVNLRPDKIWLTGDQPRMYPIDFSSYVSASMHANGILSFPGGSLEYVAPEFIRIPAESVDPLADASGAAQQRAKARNLADQYALGMVALAMLEGRLPVQIKAIADVTRLMAFQSNPRAFVVSGKARLDSSRWCRERPGLARVIWRMLAPEPEHRWSDMREVRRQLRALQSSEYDAAPDCSEAKASYRSLRDRAGFFERFYARLFEISPGIRAMFADVDMARQRTMLDGAIERVLNFRANQCPPTTLSGIARSHRHLGIAAEQFDHFGQAFLDALADEPDVDRSTLDAWEAVMWPAIEYLKHDPEREGA